MQVYVGEEGIAHSVGIVGLYAIDIVGISEYVVVSAYGEIGHLCDFNGIYGHSFEFSAQGIGKGLRVNTGDVECNGVAAMERNGLVGHIFNDNTKGLIA